jgi:hypothetical protein
MTVQEFGQNLEKLSVFLSVILPILIPNVGLESPHFMAMNGPFF